MVDDPERSRFLAAVRQKTDRHLQKFQTEGGALAHVSHQALLARTETIKLAIEQAISDSLDDIVIDITSLPKRYFFPLLKLCLREQRLRNILVAYTPAAKYATEKLSEDPEPWRQLPLFGGRYPEPEDKVVIVAAGFEPLGLPDLLSTDYQDAERRVVIPTPTDPVSFDRNWRFVRSLERSLDRSELTTSVQTVHVLNASEMFDHLVALTDGGKRYGVLAPYGPKPMSLAMCLFAVAQESVVYYTQPTAYNSDYTSDAAIDSEGPVTFSYAIRIAGKDIYTLPQ